MGIFDFLKKKGEETSAAESPEARESEGRQMLRRIRVHLNEDFRDNQESEGDIKAFLMILEKEIGKYIERKRQDQMPGDAMPLFYVSEDRMRAYACILPPVNEGEDVEPGRFLEDMHYEGVISGVAEEAVRELTETKTYLRVVRIARGEYPEDGADGALEELYEHRYAQKPELEEEEMLAGYDFRKKNLFQIIREGDVLCRITPPASMKPGFDVSGTTLNGKEGAPARVPQGKYTRISEDGLSLQAEISGIVVMEGEDFSIQSQRVLEQDIDAGVGNLKFDGDIYIRGNVKDGVTIEATGNVMIQGNIESGRILSGGTVCVQGDVKGTGKTQLKAARQIQCVIMENVAASAGEDIYAGIIANSDVVSENGSVYAMMGRGLIFGNSVTAARSVYVKKIGNISGCANSVTLGLETRLEQQKASIQSELEEIDRTLEQIRKNVSTMQMSGKSHRYDTQDEYKTLLEQRNVYGELKREKFAELDALAAAMRSMQTGSITCEEIFPVTNIRIEKQSITIEQKETDCQIRLEGGQILLR